MERSELLSCLVDLARAVGVSVREDRATGSEPELVPHSGRCRVRGEDWLVLLAHEPVEDRIAAVAEALRALAPDALEDRYLPPAVRGALEHHES